MFAWRRFQLVLILVCITDETIHLTTGREVWQAEVQRGEYVAGSHSPLDLSPGAVFTDGG
jgi:hypothetical protein